MFVRWPQGGNGNVLFKPEPQYYWPERCSDERPGQRVDSKWDYFTACELGKSLIFSNIPLPCSFVWQTIGFIVNRDGGSILDSVLLSRNVA